VGIERLGGVAARDRGSGIATRRLGSVRFGIDGVDPGEIDRLGRRRKEKRSSFGSPYGACRFGRLRHRGRGRVVVRHHSHQGTDRDEGQNGKHDRGNDHA
jgi:hypothetical protein